ncbi:MAG: ABC transporter ATP-binding protein [Verrucomicrobia bacterium]|jgi:ABC-2 type transport system ATP-binding protein|nr:ABC transporter ATP-binding protein [Verrucomicrobiota bacterium]
MIAIQNLCKTYGTFNALKDLSLEIPAGELFCFLGPNGAGKTTTIKILTGLLRPTSGTATIDGLDIAEDPIRVKQRIGYIPDMPYLYDRLTTTEFFRFTGDLYNVPREQVLAECEESFERFGLLEHRSALVKDLSHGLRQRLIYASTFLHSPSIMFIDEPFVGLDPYTIRLIKDLLRTHTRNGGTILLTTHILAIAEDIADRIGIIHQGTLTALGTLKELQAQHAETQHGNEPSTLEDIFLTLTRPLARGTQNTEPRKDLNA